MHIFYDGIISPVVSTHILMSCGCPL